MEHKEKKGKGKKISIKTMRNKKCPPPGMSMPKGMPMGGGMM